MLFDKKYLLALIAALLAVFDAVPVNSGSSYE